MTSPSAKHPLATPHDSRLIFYHIPKTAGMTLALILLRFYGWHQYNFPCKAAFIEDPETILTQFKAQAPSRLPRTRLLRGHMLYGTHTHLPGAWRGFTFLRHPVARVLSQYFYSLQNGWVKPGMLKKMVSAERNYVPSHYFVNNLQTRYLSATEGLPMPVPIGSDDMTMLALAQQRVREDLTVVGLTERFDESLLLMQQAFEWPTPYYLRVNRTRHDYQHHPEITPEVLEIITANNALDIALYEYAEALLEERIAAQGPGFPQKLEAFRRQNRLRGPLYFPFNTVMWGLHQAVSGFRQRQKPRD
jgi:hypothetical protein